MASLRLRKAACSAVSSADTTARTDKHHVSCTIHSLSRALVHASTRKNKRARTARVPQTQTNFGCKQHLVKAHVWSGHDFAWRCLSARLRLEYHSTGTYLHHRFVLPVRGEVEGAVPAAVRERVDVCLSPKRMVAKFCYFLDSYNRAQATQ